MKKLLILFIIISIKCLGQDSIHFVDSTAIWNVAKSYPHGNIQNPNFVETVTKVYGFEGDTLIGSQLWHKMYCTTDSAFLLNLIYSGNLREENGFVFFMDTTNVIDTIYNFNLQVGDSVKYDFGYFVQYIHVLNIDSLYIDESYHKKFIFAEPPISGFDYLKEIWIEGIGSLHGPIFPANPTKFSEEMPDSMYLTCYKINDTVIWSNPYYNDCYIAIILSLNELREKSGDIFIFPNPVTNELNIELRPNTDKDIVISIYDVTGKIVFKQNHRTAEKLTLDMQTLENGFYILQIESGDKTDRTKLIKE